MTGEFWLQIVLTVIPTVIALWTMWGKVNRRFGELKTQLHSSITAIEALGISYNSLIDALVIGEVIKGEKLNEVMRPYFNFNKEEIGKLKNILSPKTNPIADEEKEKLQIYISKIEKSQDLTTEEADELWKLVTKLKEELPSNKGVDKLITLASLARLKALNNEFKKLLEESKNKEKCSEKALK